MSTSKVLKSLVCSAQSDLVEQIGRVIPVHQDVGARMAAASVTAAMALCAAMAPTDSQAQNYQYNGQYGTNSAIVDSAGRAGQIIGYERGRSAGVGSEVGRIVSDGSRAAAQVATGEAINVPNVARVLGGAIGGLAGYKVAGKDNRAGQVIGTAIGGTLGVVVGGMAGDAYAQREFEQERAQYAQRNPITREDQAQFLRAMQAASAQRAVEDQSRNNNPYGQNARYTPNGQYGQYGQGNRQVQPQQSSQVRFTGQLEAAVRQSNISPVPSGRMVPDSGALNDLTYKGLHLVKAGEKYGQMVDHWDMAYANGQTNMVKESLNREICASWGHLRNAAMQYMIVRNQVASRGGDVTPVDGAIEQQIGNLRAQQRYNDGSRATFSQCRV